MYFFSNEYIIHWVTLDFNIDFFVIAQSYFDCVIQNTKNFEIAFVNTKEKVCFVEYMFLYRNYLRNYIFHPYLNNFYTPTYLLYLLRILLDSELYYFLNNYFGLLFLMQDMVGRFVYLCTYIFFFRKGVMLNTYAGLFIFYKEFFFSYFAFWLQYILIFFVVFEIVILFLIFLYILLCSIPFVFYTKMLKFYTDCFIAFSERLLFSFWSFCWNLFKKKFVYSMFHLFGGEKRSKAVDLFWDGLNYVYWRRFLYEKKEDFFFIDLFSIFVFFFAVFLFFFKFLFKNINLFVKNFVKFSILFYKEYGLYIVSKLLFDFQYKVYCFKKYDFIFFVYFFIENKYWELFELFELSVIWEIKYIQWKLLNTILQFIFKKDDDTLDFEEYDMAVKFLLRFGVGEKDAFDGLRFIFYRRIFDYFFDYVNISYFKLNYWFGFEHFYKFNEFYLQKILFFFKMRFFFTFRYKFLDYNIVVFSMLLFYQYCFYLYYSYFFVKIKLNINKAYLVYYYKYFLKDLIKTYRIFVFFMLFFDIVYSFKNKFVVQCFLCVQWIKIKYMYIYYYFSYVFYFVRFLFFFFYIFFRWILLAVKSVFFSKIVWFICVFSFFILLINVFQYDLATMNVYFFRVINFLNRTNFDLFGILGMLTIFFTHFDKSFFSIYFVVYVFNCFCSLIVFYVYEFYFWWEDLFFNYSDVFLYLWDRLYLKYVYHFTYTLKHMKRLLFFPISFKKWYIFFYIKHKWQFLYYFYVKVCIGYVGFFMTLKLWYFALIFFLYNFFHCFFVSAYSLFYIKFNVFLCICYYIYYVIVNFVFYFIDYICIYLRAFVYFVFVDRLHFDFIFSFINKSILDLKRYMFYFNIYTYHFVKYDCFKYFIFADFLTVFFKVNAYLHHFLFSNIRYFLAYIDYFYTFFLQFFLINDFIENCFCNVKAFFNVLFVSYDSYVRRDSGFMDIDKVLVYFRRRTIFKSVSNHHMLFRNDFERFILVTCFYNVSVYRWDLFSLVNIESFDYFYWIYYSTRYYALYVVLFFLLCSFSKKFCIFFKSKFNLFGYSFVLFRDFSKLEKFSVLDHEWLTDTKWMGSFYSFSNFSDVLVNKEGDIIMESLGMPNLESKEKIQLDYFLNFYDKLFSYSTMFKEFALLNEYWFLRLFLIKSLIDEVYLKRIRKHRWVFSNFVEKGFWLPKNHLSSLVEKNVEWMYYINEIKNFYSNFVLEYLINKCRDKTFYYNFKKDIHKHFFWYRLLQKKDVKNFNNLMYINFNFYNVVAEYFNNYTDSLKSDSIFKFNSSRLKLPSILTTRRPYVTVECQPVFDQLYKFISWAYRINENYLNDYLLIGLKDYFFSYYFEEVFLSKDEFKKGLMTEFSYGMQVDLGIYEELLDTEFDFIEEVYSRRVNELLESTVYSFDNRNYNLFYYESEGFLSMFLVHVFYLFGNTCFHFFRNWLRFRRTPKIIYSLELFFFVFLKYFYPTYFFQSIQWKFMFFPKLFLRRDKRRVKFNSNSYKFMSMLYDGYESNQLIYLNLIFGSGNCLKITTSFGFFSAFFFNYTYIDLMLFGCFFVFLHFFYYVYNKFVFIYNNG